MDPRNTYRSQMTPMERAAAMAKGETVDRMPCNPNIANGTARILGCKISEFNTDPKTLAGAQIAAYRKYGYDSTRIFTDLFTWCEAMGAKVILPDDDTADLLEPACKDVKDIDKLEPIDPYTGGRLPIHVEAMKILIDEVGKEVAVSGGVVGPFTNAFFLIGVDKMLTMITKDPENVHKLCKISLESCKRWAQAVIDCGLTPTISEPMSSCTVVSPRTFREFSKPYLDELVQYIRSHGKGVVMHICGQTNKIWPDLADMGIAGMSIDNVASIVECKQMIGDRVRVCGNVDPGSIMYAGTPLDVRIGVLKCVRDGWDSPKGFMVMSGCSLPVDSPQENIKMFMDTVHDIGYPVNIDWIEAELARCEQLRAEGGNL